jgi:hypothetical protein
MRQVNGHLLRRELVEKPVEELNGKQGVKLQLLLADRFFR